MPGIRLWRHALRRRTGCVRPHGLPPAHGWRAQGGRHRPRRTSLHLGVDEAGALQVWPRLHASHAGGVATQIVRVVRRRSHRKGHLLLRLLFRQFDSCHWPHHRRCQQPTSAFPDVEEVPAVRDEHSQADGSHPRVRQQHHARPALRRVPDAGRHEAHRGLQAERVHHRARPPEPRRGRARAWPVWRQQRRAARQAARHDGRGVRPGLGARVPAPHDQLRRRRRAQAARAASRAAGAMRHQRAHHRHPRLARRPG
mmetsp:Transcript_29535/g.96507  ORF Transcript_29535/g.96507 Transcript_29535/m.96507 type:complete len:255 (-) Transcript_29535:499-1263(-)